MANTFTHLWAFRIVCLSELKRFITHFLDNEQGQPAWIGQLDMNYAEIQAQMMTCAKSISLSMVYLLQDEMRLFGPASTFFPLQMAHQTFKAQEFGQEVDLAYIEKIVDELDQKGLMSARALIFDDSMQR
ncbi:hypothetical protein N7517_009382 [Penicillium concentricum]|uniref:Uncharacterized protein n=1 Tax=Penicillium concentricum TaxID=293559 RepID=A0A9W9UZ48_9EURO|nr:uncharacterized protein N7517_009382 [Penicillium concentricum]KAJ5360191.1 hypothetical protein N7517_009382 [Penicillium concentricum]